MSEIVLPLLFALFVWWFTTGVVFWLVRLPRSTHRWSLGGAGVLMAASLYGMAETAADASVGAVYLAFTFAILAWGWIELGFLTGYVTGPRRTPCPPDCSGWWRAGIAIQAILHHELALVALGGAIALVTWGGVNQIALWTFLLLWGMRLSAKFNLFLGVANRNSELLPDHLRFMDSFFARRAINGLFPISVSASAALAALLWWSAADPMAASFEAAGFALLAALTALALLEHWFMVLPLPSTVLWRWALRSGTDRTEPVAAKAGASGVVGGGGSRQSVAGMTLVARDAIAVGAVRPPHDRRVTVVPAEPRPSVASAVPCTIVPLPVSSVHRRRP